MNPIFQKVTEEIDPLDFSPWWCPDDDQLYDPECPEIILERDAPFIPTAIKIPIEREYYPTKAIQKDMVRLSLGVYDPEQELLLYVKYSENSMFVIGPVFQEF